MKLLTHNLLKCNIKNCNHFPLRITATELQNIDVPEFQEETIQLFTQKIDQNILQQAVEQLKLDFPMDSQSYARILFGVEIVEGTLQCEKCGREFPINKGIPNMLLREDEV